MACLWMVMAIASLPIDEVPSGEVLRLFDRHYYDVQYEHDRTKSYIYHLFKPPKLTAGRKYPLIVWLHGYGDVEFEEIGSGHLKHTGAVFSSVEDADEFNFYFLVVQCPSDQRGFFLEEQPDGVPQPGDVTAQLIEKLINEKPINAEQVTLIGISGAGADCLEMGMRYPGRFAGMALLGSPEGKLSRLESLLETPIWAFHASEDPKISSDGILRSLTAIQEAGGDTHLTIIEANYHNCWAVAFRDYNVLEWLLSQKRGDFFAPSPGKPPASFLRRVLIWSAGLLLLAVLLRKGRRLKRNPTI
ncbi:carboxylesterase family protein [Botrimarina hoheduenensis]|uniref:Alpha/beta hydrolase family protein n=1 Tax=Botrimarina hoheduenensis TaxID=2528000 RepID=A0A5C5VRT5_9BACT|nr:hypothetical protein [Botrimarina hoheduenensis]TWT41346.1 Alpha/beta hydrolase family protein [Botrimarina hoheduenensis]